MIPEFSNTTRQADVRDGPDPGQWKIQVALVEIMVTEENPQTTRYLVRGWKIFVVCPRQCL